MCCSILRHPRRTPRDELLYLVPSIRYMCNACEASPRRCPAINTLARLARKSSQTVLLTMDVLTGLKFCKRDPKWSYEKAFSLSYNPPLGIDKSNVEHESVEVMLNDVRPFKNSLRLDREGFQVVDLESKLSYREFFERDQVQEVFAEEVRNTLKKLLGADGIFFHETVVSSWVQAKT